MDSPLRMTRRFSRIIVDVREDHHLARILFPWTLAESRDGWYDRWYPLKRSLVPRNVGERQTKRSKAFTRPSPHRPEVKGERLATRDYFPFTHRNYLLLSLSTSPVSVSEVEMDNAYLRTSQRQVGYPSSRQQTVYLKDC